jgi:transposase-like protein
MSKEEKRRLIEAYAASGMTRREYCAQHGIAVSTLDYWRSKRSKGKTRKPKLARVTMALPQAGPGFTLTLSNGRRIESSWSFAEADLTRLIRAVEA